jgi:hypothetical protein
MNRPMKKRKVTMREVFATHHQFTLRLDDFDFDKVKQIMIAERLSQSEAIRNAIRQYKDKLYPKRGVYVSNRINDKASKTLEE